MSSASLSERAVMVASTVCRSKSDRSASTMSVSSYSDDSEMGPMDWGMPR